MIELGAWLGLAAALLPAAMFLKNRRLFLAPRQLAVAVGPNGSGAAHRASETSDGGSTAPAAPPAPPVAVPAVSVLIPARDEQHCIAAAVESVLASQAVTVEVIVLDDHSGDATAAEVQRIAADDDRVRLVSGQPLPAGWNGKQFACYQLSQLAKYDCLLFMDADVRLSPAALADLLGCLEAGRMGLLSLFPRQRTGSWLECWLIPLMHVILLGYLPLERMRRSRHPAYAAGCGQLFLTRQAEYQLAGTHRAIAASRHDGLKLPAAYRRAGLATDLADGTELASCRMYRSAGEVIRGLLKNADEGIASPRRLIPFTLLLLGASLWPVVTLALAWQADRPVAIAVSGLAITLGHFPRIVAAAQFRQSSYGVLFHIAAVTLFVGLQWVAFFAKALGQKPAWKGRN